MSSPEPTLVDLLGLGALDGQLAGLAWLLIESGVPVVVAGRDDHGRIAVRDALTVLVSSRRRRVTVEASGRGLEGLTAADATTTCLVGIDLTSSPAPALQVPFKALARGVQLVASADADSLEDVFDRLRRPDLRLTDDELGFIGLALVVRTVVDQAMPDPGVAAGDARTRVVVAHYVRPVARDAAGHLQRLGPAVLAAWDGATDRFEQFAWGVATELADRTGLQPGAVDGEVDRRAEYLAGLRSGGVVQPEAVRLAVEAYRLSDKRPGGPRGV